MPTEEPFATRRELDMLISRVDNIDNTGTRGVISLQQQLTDAIKDIVEIRLDMTNFKQETAKWFQHHAAVHDADVTARRMERDADLKARLDEREADRRERTNTRRWMIGTIIAFFATIGGMYEFLNVILQHVH